MLRFCAPAAYGVIALAMIPATAFAEQHQRTVSGTCSKLAFGDQDLTSQCRPDLIQVVDSSGMIAYVFTRTDQSIASFVGKENGTTKPDGLNALTLSRFGMDNKSEGQRILINHAHGSCEVKDEEKKRTIHCRSTLGSGKTYEGIFILTTTAQSNPTSP